MNEKITNNTTCPIWEKEFLTLNEAVEYFGIGKDTLRRITDEQVNRFVLWVGNKRMIKRRKLLSYLEEEYSI